MLYTILYISNADRAFDSEELDKLVSESRDWNSIYGITGFLAYVEGVLNGKTRCQFIQILEGKKRHVEDVINIIKQDTRHQDICVLKEGYIKARKFDSWNMGFERIHLNSDPKLKLFFSMNLSLLSEDGDLDNNILIQFMKTFYDENKQLHKSLKHPDIPRPDFIAFRPNVLRFCTN